MVIIEKRGGKESSLEKGLIYADYVNNDSQLELRCKAIMRHRSKSINTDSRQSQAKLSGVLLVICSVYYHM